MGPNGERPGEPLVRVRDVGAALGELLSTLATAHRLDPEVHPSYRRPPREPQTDDEHRAS